MAASDNGAGNSAQPALDVARHLRYFQRCFRTLLPRQYTSNDSTRMALGFFVIAGMDLLTPDQPTAADAAAGSRPKNARLTGEDRRRLRAWVLSAQHTHGGFCGSPTHALPTHEYDGWDFATASPEPASPGSTNLAATAFALLILALVADPESPESAFAGVDRAATLHWLRRLQRPDGSFGEVLVEMPARPGEAPRRIIAGGRDMRYCYFAAIIRWALRGDVRPGDAAWVEDIDVQALAQYTRQAQTFDGGVGESSMHESHAGYAYCAVSALSLLERPAEGGDASGRCGLDETSLLRFLVSRQMAYQDPTDDGADDNADDGNFPQPRALSRDDIAEACPAHVGLNGRCNKVADTCYCWWVAGTLAILGRQQNSDGSVELAREPARRFLMEKTQHMIGGFSKHPGGPPDVYHAYFGLAALAAMGEDVLGDFDVTFCVSSRTVSRMEAARRGLLRQYGSANSTSAHELVRMGELLAGCKAEKLVGKSADHGQDDEGLLLEQLLSRRMLRP